MSTPTTPAAAAQPTNGGPAKSTKMTKLMLVLRLPAILLARFPHPQPQTQAQAQQQQQSAARTAKSKPSTTSSTSSTSTPLPKSINAATPPDDASTPAATPLPDDLANPATDPPATTTLKRKGGPASKPAAAKPSSTPITDANGIPKQIRRPGPKKRTKLDGDTSSATPKGWTLQGQAASSAHKLGPKANQGAINAGLRALDRSGKPCRKWIKQSFTLKSFTGVQWGVPSWRRPKHMLLLGQDSGDTPNPDENKANGHDGSAGDSEPSNVVEEPAMPPPDSFLASSPPEAAQATA